MQINIIDLRLDAQNIGPVVVVVTYISLGIKEILNQDLALVGILDINELDRFAT